MFGPPPAALTSLSSSAARLRRWWSERAQSKPAFPKLLLRPGTRAEGARVLHITAVCVEGEAGG